MPVVAIKRVGAAVEAARRQNDGGKTRRRVEKKNAEIRFGVN